jgi:hypothetical protein
LFEAYGVLSLTEEGEEFHQEALRWYGPGGWLTDGVPLSISLSLVGHVHSPALVAEKE